MALRSNTGIYAIAETIQRTLPTSTNDVTHEKIHASVLQQRHPNPGAQSAIQADPSIVAPLNPLEQYIKDNWRVTHVSQETVVHDEGHGTDSKDLENVLHAAKQAIKGGENIGKALLHSISHKQDAASASSAPNHDQISLEKLLHEHSMGAVFREILGDTHRGGSQ